MPTTVNYKLCLSASDITVTEICFNNICIKGAELQEDLNGDDNCYQGTLRGVVCDCQKINVFVQANGPVGRTMELEAEMCEGKKLKNQPINITCENGSCSFSETLDLNN